MLGSAGCQPAVAGSLPATDARSALWRRQTRLGNLPSRTGCQPVLPGIMARGVKLKLATSSLPAEIC